jgi:HPt (histidine-containing phosphotransfer) domain-containing protein
MDIQKLLLSGYNLSDIKELLCLFMANLNEAKKVIIGSNKVHIKQTLHKIKGGLIMLEFKVLIESCSSIETEIGVYDEKTLIHLVNSLFDKCISESVSASNKLDILISNNDINS